MESTACSIFSQFQKPRPSCCLIKTTASNGQFEVICTHILLEYCRPALQVLEKALTKSTAAEIVEELGKTIRPWKREKTYEYIIHLVCEWGSTFLPAARLRILMTSGDRQSHPSLKPSRYAGTLFWRYPFLVVWRIGTADIPPYIYVSVSTVAHIQHQIYSTWRLNSWPSTLQLKCLCHFLQKVICAGQGLVTQACHAGSFSAFQFSDCFRAFCCSNGWICKASSKHGSSAGQCLCNTAVIKPVWSFSSRQAPHPGVWLALILYLSVLKSTYTDLYPWLQSKSSQSKIENLISSLP